MGRIKFHQIKIHPWLRDYFPFGIEIFIKNNIQSHCKVSEEVFNQLIKLKIDFHKLPIDKIKEAIKRKKDYSFVVAYYLLYNDFIKKKSIPNINTEFLNKQKNHDLQPVFKQINDIVHVIQ